MMKSDAAPDAVATAGGTDLEVEVAYLSKRHRVSPAIVREIIRKTGASERSAIEREIRKGLSRR